MKTGPAAEIVVQTLSECQGGTFGSLVCDEKEWARCRNYFTILLGMVKESAVLSDMQAYVVVEKVVQIMRANVHRDDKVIFPWMEDIQLATYINTAQ